MTRRTSRGAIDPLPNAPSARLSGQSQRNSRFISERSEIFEGDPCWNCSTNSGRRDERDRDPLLRSGWDAA